MRTVQFPVFIRLLFFQSPLIGVHLEDTVFASLFISTLTYQFVVFMLFILTIVKAFFKVSQDIGRMITVYDTVLTIQGFISLQVPEQDAAVSHIYS